MKTLIVMRHAETQGYFTASSDYERELTNKGRMDAHRASQWIGIQFQLDKILHSSAVRTTQTAEIIQQACTPNLLSAKPNLYNCSTIELLQEVVNLPSEYTQVLLIGHNPGISQLVTNLTSERLSMQPAEIACIQFEIDDWSHIVKGSGRLYRTNK